MDLPYAEPYRIKAVRRINKSTREEREAWIKQAKFNLFNLRSDQVFIDLLTDSGTGAMSDEQWGRFMRGDESYAGSDSYYELKSTVKSVLGFERFLPTHQGRAAEDVLFSTILKEGDLVPGNKHFDTTKGHIEYRKAKAIDCTIDESKKVSSSHPFKGNIDLNKLEKVLSKNSTDKIPVVMLTITCNSVGGQPVSMKNIAETASLCDTYGVPLFFDAARFAENAYFIKTGEDGYESTRIKDIVKEMFSHVSGFTMSAKKDGIVNIGGILGLRDKELFDRAKVHNIMKEGYVTYGGMAGRDMAALAQGLKESTEFDYLHSRIAQIDHFGSKLQEYGVPVLTPFGGHAIFVDALETLPDVSQEEFVAQLLAVELYLEAGVRGVEIGTLLADRDPDTGQNRYPRLELLRLAVPRRTYTNNHLDYAAAGLGNVYQRRDQYTRGLKIVKQAPILRHFTVELERVN